MLITQQIWIIIKGLAIDYFDSSIYFNSITYFNSVVNVLLTRVFFLISFILYLEYMYVKIMNM
jgi:hypothetical protein